MSTIIDERVVEMRFDNKQFESNVATSMSSINKLKHSLDLSGASKGLSSVSPAIGDTRRSLENLEYAAYKTGFRWGDVAHKISSVAEWRIARQAIDTVETSVKNLANSLLGLTAMKTGFAEYETQMGAIQTILANTKKEGTTLDDVNGALDELNAYADKTIYNFTEMTKNIGTFTAAGVKLDTSVQAIKGIANLAAVSGSTSQQASTAMYQLSQAMASGTVKLMDWNSVVNAGMGGQVFQDALKETARVHGIAIDDIISKNGSFRESLSEGWLTTEILTDTLAKFTGDLTEEQLKAQGYTEEQIKGILDLGDTANRAATEVKTFTQLMDTLKEAAQSGWSQTWRILVGDFEEAKELFTEVSDVIGGMIGASAESRNELLENWKVLGGRQDIIDSISNVFWGLMDVITPIKEAFTEIFPPLTAEQLKEFTQRLKDLTSGFRLSEKASDNLKRTFKGLFAVLKIAGQLIGGVFKVVGAVLSVFGDIMGVVFGLTGGIGDLLVGFSDLITEGNLINKIFTGIAKVIKAIGKVVTTLFKFITKIFAFPGLEILVSLLDGIYGRLTKVRESTSEFGGGFADAFAAIGNAIRNNPIVKFLGTVLKSAKTLFVGLAKALGSVLGELGHRIANADIVGLLEIMNEIIAGGVGIQLIKWLKNLTGAKSGFEDIIGGFEDVLDSLSGALKGFQNSLNAQALKDIAIAIAILAGSLLVLSFIDSEKLTDASAAIIVLFSGLMGCLSILGKSSVSGLDAAAIAASTARIVALGQVMKSLATAVLILSAALFIIGKLDNEAMLTGLAGVLGLMAILTASMKILSTDSKVVTKGAVQMIIVAFACKMLANILLEIAELSWSEMWRGLIGMVVCMATIVGAMKILPLGTKTIGKPFWKFCTQLIVVAKAAGILADVLIDLSTLSWKELAVGMVGMVGCMTVLVGAMKILATITDTGLFEKKFAKTITHDFIGMAAAILALALAIRIIAPALKTFAAMNWEELGKAAAALGGLLAFFTLFALAIKLVKPEVVMKTAASLLIISGSMLIIAGACKIFAAMKWESLAKGASVLLTIVGVLMLLGLATKWIKPGTMAAAAASLTILAAALTMLVPSLLVLSLMSWESLAKGAATIVTLVGALMLLGLATKWTNPGAIAVMAASMVILAAALQMLVVPLLIFSQLSWGSLAKAGAVLAAMVAALTLVALVSKLAAPGILAFAGALALLGLSLGLIAGSIALIGASLATLGAGLVVFGGAIVVILKEIIAACEVVLVGIVELIGKFLVALLNSMGDIALAAAEALNAILFAIADVLVNGAPVLIEAILVLITKVLDQLVRYAPGIVESIAELIVKVLQSLTKYIQPIVEVLIDILIAIFDGIAARAPELIVSFVNIFVAIFDGLAVALNSIAPGIILDAVLAFGVIALLMKTFASISSFGPAALLGVLWAGIIFAEITALIAVIGAIGQIPGFTWLVNEGGKVLEAVGGAIGKFVGALVGGFGAGVASMLPEIAGYLSDFMVNLQPFLDNIKKVDGSVLTSTLTLIATMLAFGAGGLATMLTGGLFGLGGLVAFGIQLAAFGPWFAKYYDSIKDVDADVVTSTANAAQALATMANSVPKMGGLASLIAGENDLSKWGPQLVALGEALVDYAEAVSELDESSIQNINNSVGAAKSLVELANAIPNQGGLTALLAGDNNFGKWGPDLVTLGNSLVDYADSVDDLDETKIAAIDNSVKAAMGIVELSKQIPNSGGVVSWFAGDNSISKLSSDLGQLGTGIKDFATNVGDANPDTVTDAAKAGEALAEMTKHIPNEGGVASWFAGENSISKFAGELSALGTGIFEFSKNTEGISTETITDAVDAAKSLAEMTTHIPTEGGVKAWFAGENSVAKFGNDLVSLGMGIATFASITTGINTETVTAAADAAKVLADMTTHIPNEGGVKAWFAGDNSVAKFAANLPSLGEGLKGFSASAENVSYIDVMFAAQAAKSLAEMTNTIPNEGGVKAWFSGDNSISKFAANLPSLGEGLKGFSDSVTGINSDNITAAADAVKVLADMTDTIPNEGGVKAWFAGENSVAKFGEGLVSLGMGIATFASITTGINTETVTAAAEAAKVLAEMTDTIPNEGGAKAWFTGEASISNFADNLSSLGRGLKGFSDSVTGTSPVDVMLAAQAAQSLADMTTHIPNEGGVKAWFTGEASISNFAAKLPKLGAGLKGFSDSVTGINPDNITAAANSAQALADMTTHIPNEGGIKAWFTGEACISNFADKLPDLGEGLKGFSDSVTGINPDNITAAASSAKSLAQMTDSIPKNTEKIVSFGTNLTKFGSKLRSYFEFMSKITPDSITTSNNAIGAVMDLSSVDSGNIESLSKAIDETAESIKNLSSVPKDTASSFAKTLKDLGKTSSETFLNSFNDLGSDLEEKAKAAMDLFISGIQVKALDAAKACMGVADTCVTAISNKSGSFEKAGKSVASGFAAGISANTFKAEAKAKAMAEAALEAARKALDVNSPSKVFRALGYSVPEGFAMGIDKFAWMATDSSIAMTDRTIDSVKNGISRIADAVNSDIDAQPTIRPVLDLSDVKSGASTISSMFGSKSLLGVTANVGSIATSMNQRNQNGGNAELLSAINGLRKDIRNNPSTTNIVNGVTYDDGSNIKDAVEGIVRAARIERRM